MAEAKERHGLRHAQYRGRAKVRIQAFGAAMAYSIKKLVRWHGRHPEDTALAVRQAPHPLVPDRTSRCGLLHHVCQYCQPFSPN